VAVAKKNDGVSDSFDMISLLLNVAGATERHDTGYSSREGEGSNW
jgi:hypothetical protein